MRLSKKRFACAAGVCLVAWLIGFYLLPLLIKLPPGLANPQAPSVIYTDRNGELLRRELTASGTKVGPPITHYGELPEGLIHATLAAEDKRFFKHSGIDSLSMGRAVFDKIRTGKTKSGASTITQQLVKISSKPRPRNLFTKLIEIVTARKIELTFSKQQILVNYLNRLPYGNQLQGCTAAANQYFGKSVADLSLAESAFLAGLPNQPTRLSPYTNFDGAKRKQETILSRLSATGWIDAAELSVAKVEPLRIMDRYRSNFLAPHFVELVRQKNTDVSVVVTSLELPIQQMVERHIEHQLNHLSANQSSYRDIQAAAVVLDSQTSEILALVGSRSFTDSESGQINGATAARSAGSTLKPFTYLLAMQQGYTAASVLADTPIEYVSRAGAFQPVNFDRRYRGPVALREALATSLNIPAVRVLNDIGGHLKLHRLMRDQLSFTALNDNGHTYGLGLTIGNAEVRLLELTNAYACLARLGSFKPYTSVPSQTVAETPIVFEKAHAWIMSDILSDNTARYAAFGAESSLKLPFRVAAKTGTSTDYRDNWVISYTPEYTVGVWVGRFNNEPLPDQLTGAKSAGPIVHQIWLSLAELRQPTWFPKPDSVIEYEVDVLNGKRLPKDFHIQPNKVKKEYFNTINKPELATKSDYTKDGKTKLSSSYQAWWQANTSPIKSIASVEEVTNSTLTILSPKSGTVAYLDPDLPNGGSHFPLRIAGGQKVEWQSSTLEIKGNGTSRAKAVLKEGTHQLQVRSEETGEVANTEIVVEAL